MHKLALSLLGCSALLTVAAAPALAGVTYSLRDARFFGETNGRETTDSGTFAPGTSEDLTVNFSTGGPAPTTFDATSTNQASPFRLGVSNHVSAQADTALNFNTDPFGPTATVSVVTSQVTETGVVVTGGSGSGYLLPTFRLKGSFSDSHDTAFGWILMCAGISQCVLTSVADSTGPADVDTTWTPAINQWTEFTFDTPFTFFFFVSAAIQSFTTGNLAPGEIGIDFTDGLELLSVAVVDANGDPIPGAVVQSELLSLIFAPTAVPEPGMLALLGLGLGALVGRRRLRR